MTTTANLGLTLLEIGQKDKEVTINTNFSAIDTKVPKYCGQLTVDPSTSGLPAGSTYYNTGISKLKVLLSTGTWVNAA
jgi:hypothetical protein